MNDSPRKVSPLRQRMIEEMRMRQLAPKTRDAYIRAVIHFTRFLGRSPDTATAEELRRYQLHCVDQGRVKRRPKTRIRRKKRSQSKPANRRTPR